MGRQFPHRISSTQMNGEKCLKSVKYYIQESFLCAQFSMTWRSFTLLSISLVYLLIPSCTQDQVAEPEPCLEVKTYNQGLREIIVNKCNTSGCHDGSSGVGNYNSYGGLRRVIQNGEFRQLVVIEKTMPRNTTLSEVEFKLLKCWSENGYPEE